MFALRLHVLLCVCCLCWCSRQTRCFSKFSLEIHCRKMSNAEASQLKERVNWKTSRVTSGAAYFCEVRISGIVDQIGSDYLVLWTRSESGYLVLLIRLTIWNSRVTDQDENLELSWCRQKERGNFVLS